MTEFGLVMTTVEDATAAKTMARALVEAKLAACVQIVPIASVYRWEGAVEEAQEQLLLCKIAVSGFAALEAGIRERHTYDVPEIVMVPIQTGHQPYLDWIVSSTRY